MTAKFLRVSEWTVAIAAIILLIWDIVAQGTVGVGGTISTVAWNASAAYPMLAPSVGFIMGHLFSGSVKIRAENKFNTPLRITSTTLQAVLLIIELIGLLNTADVIETMRSAEFAFVRFIIGALFGRWFWAGPVKSAS